MIDDRWARSSLIIYNTFYNTQVFKHKHEETTFIFNNISEFRDSVFF